MNRYVSIVMALFGLLFSHIASGSEWKVESGDSLWQIVKEGCQVTPSMDKVRVFARAVGIQTPSLIVIGERIDVSRGCSALPDALAASLAKAVVLSNQQGETLRAMNAQLAVLEAEVWKFRQNYEASQQISATGQAVVAAFVAEPERPAGSVHSLSSNMGESVSRGTGAKGYYAYGDPVSFFKGWMILVAAGCCFMLFSALWKLWKRKRGGIVMPGDQVDGETVGSSMPPVNGRDLCFLRNRLTVDIPL